MDAAVLPIGRVEAPAGQGERKLRSVAKRSAGGTPVAECGRGCTLSARWALPRLLSSATLAGGPMASSSVSSVSFRSLKGRSDLPFRFASGGWQAFSSVPCQRAKSTAGGWRRKRRPWERPSAPMRSVRETLGTPPSSS